MKSIMDKAIKNIITVCHLLIKYVNWKKYFVLKLCKM